MTTPALRATPPNLGGVERTRGGGCPTGCGRNVKIGNIMCAPCWHLVPRELQTPVWAAWRALNKARDKGWAQRHIDTLKREHEEAKTAAIAAVKERISQRELAL